MPRDVFVELWASHERRAERNRRMARELLRIVDSFEASGILALPYKGPALAASVYGDIALREFADLDILLRRRDVERAMALLRDQGYEPDDPLSPAARAAVLDARSHYHLSLFNAAISVMVELHWKTDAHFPVEASEADQWWAGLERAPLLDGHVRAFEPRELMLVLCLHGSKHHWSSMGWLVDVAELIRQNPRLDWPWLVARAREMACERRLAVGLQLAHVMLDAPLPGDVRDWIGSHAKAVELSRALVPMMLQPGGGEIHALQRLALDLKLQDHAWQRIRHFVEVALEPSLWERSRIALPRSLYFLLVPVRLARLLRKYVGVAWSAMRGR